MAAWAEKEKAIRSLERDGELDPHDIVREARDPESVLHDSFEWDDAKAGAAYRLDQARALIRRVEFEVVVEERGERVVQYVARPDTELSRYRSLDRVRTVDTADDVLRSELRALRGHASRVVGIATAKASLIGPDRVAQIRAVRDAIESLL